MIEYGHGEIPAFKELSKRINLDFYFHVQETHVPSQESEKLVWVSQDPYVLNALFPRKSTK